MALDDDIRVLSGVGLFRGLAHEHLHLLAFGAESVDLRAGQFLYREGNPAASAYVVMSGLVGLFRLVDGESRIVAEAHPGMALGELALIAPTHRMTDAAAMADSRLINIDRKIFRRILEEYPGVASRLHRQLLEEFQAMVRLMEEVAPPDEE